jgi:peroxiredoxin
MNKQFLILILLISVLSCKQENNYFNVKIKTETKSDSLSMYPSFVSEKFLDSSYSMLFKAKIENGTVEFRGNKPSHPIMFDILDMNYGFSEKFFIDGGSTELFVSFANNDKEIVIPDKLKSKSQKEYESLKEYGLDSLNKLWWSVKTVEERRNIGIEKDSLIINFLRENPNSYVPLWLLVDNFSKKFKYNKLYDESINLFSNEIKQTLLFKQFKSSLTESKSFTFVNKEFELKNLNLENVNFRLDDLENKDVILLDFWFSNCAPCLRDMDKYISLYKKYNKLGFEIVSISSDKTSKIDNWKKVIADKDFIWTHYLDENAIETHKINITSFPTTFLVDKDGTIIKQNINPEQLSEYLAENLD